ncbi:N-acetylmuramoyl-L-alanine amidase [Paenibacillus sp. sgz500958]|uniref:N-acetylmuramoyl-L-alanine amidase n=1 Tax=Paenibacillus sp. sgz500958 TaxID=3242475 RepID=UPI0036D2B845
MPYKGFVIHHSDCTSINGKGFDFWVDPEGMFFAAPMLTDPDYIHICLEGDFNLKDTTASGSGRKDQLFSAGRLILELATRYQISPLIVEPHGNSCPGTFFPWNELVIYPSDGYH